MNCDINPDPKYQTRDEKLTLLERRVETLEQEERLTATILSEISVKLAELCESIKKIEGQ